MNMKTVKYYFGAACGVYAVDISNPSEDMRYFGESFQHWSSVPLAGRSVGLACEKPIREITADEAKARYPDFYEE